MMILNLTQHPATPEQKAAGVVDLTGDALAFLINRLTFDDLPSQEEIRDRAIDIADMAVMNNGLAINDDDEDPVPGKAMIGGALWLMPVLAFELDERGVKPLYSFSKRESVEEPQSDGTVKKIASFRHLGFLAAI